MPRIKLDNLIKRYGLVEVLHGIDLEMAENEFTVLVGLSGCGKSTMLRCIAGLETVTEGEIFVDGSPISHLEPKERDLAMVFQDYALYPHMNVAKNMSFALRLERQPKAEIEQKVKAVAEMLGLAQFLHRKPGELSGGQRQRVAMGRALVRDASTFLFDEPLSNLDAKLRAKMRTELKEMHNMLNKNMIYVTHDQIEAMTLGDRIVVMHNGIVQQQGTPHTLFTNPANKFVAGFIGTPAMNFLEGEIESANGATIVTGNGFSLALSQEQQSRLSGHKGKQVSVGIRPFAIKTDAHPDSHIDLKVKLVEYLGSTSVLVAMVGDTEVHVETDNSTTPDGLGSELRFSAAPDDILLFDHDTEIRI